MTKTILICDDSKMARKQLLRSLPENLDAQVLQAEHGQEALEILNEVSVDLLFLDLNMPVMDGYEVLDVLQKTKTKVTTLVVSGDVQQQARERVKKLGALEFIKKPIQKVNLEKLTKALGLTTVEAETKHQAAEPPAKEESKLNFRDVYQEIANVSMGQAGELLAKMLGVFVTLPVPNVNMLELSDLEMILTLASQDRATGISQGFIGRGITGEALLLINDMSIESLAKIMDYSGDMTQAIERELVMDIANILIGAFLKSFGKQLNIAFNQGHPNILGEHKRISNLMKLQSENSQKIMAIEITYGIENTDINCSQLMLFTVESVETLTKHMDFLTED